MNGIGQSVRATQNRSLYDDNKAVHSLLRYGAPEPRLKWDNGLWVIFGFKPPGEVKTLVNIIEVLQVNPTMTLAEVADEIGKSLSAVERASAKLVREGRLKYAGPAKGGHWVVLK